jgi:hypothetical protein
MQIPLYGRPAGLFWLFTLFLAIQDSFFRFFSPRGRKSSSSTSDPPIPQGSSGELGYQSYQGGGRSLDHCGGIAPYTRATFSAPQGDKLQAKTALSATVASFNLDKPVFSS